MEIDNQPLSTQLQTTTQVDSTEQQVTNNESNDETDDTTLNTSSTLELSETGQTLSSSSVTETSDNNEIDSEEQAQLSAEQFQKDAANDPSLTENAQSSNVTSDLVTSLIGS